MTVITRDGIRLPPEAEMIPFSIRLMLRPPFGDLLKFSGICGCTGGPSYRFEISRTAAEVKSAVDAFLDAIEQSRPEEELRIHTDALFNT
jgi:hypothetical protein